ncbi:hypothetical protein [Pseudarthrobacter sp.]
MTCPDSGSTEIRSLPTNACVYFYRCTACGATSKPPAL